KSYFISHFENMGLAERCAKLFHSPSDCFLWPEYADWAGRIFAPREPFANLPQAEKRNRPLAKGKFPASFCATIVP
ncbi:MAG TPA: hypothetical protein DEA63_05515, partial [Firmicutes bacterium]|nr:hypothetical protein [Bacillota bacterium]